MSVNENQRVVCFVLPPRSIAVARFASMVCKLQSRFTNTPRVRIERRSETIINSTYCRFLFLVSLHTTFVKS